MLNSSNPPPKNNKKKSLLHMYIIAMYIPKNLKVIYNNKYFSLIILFYIN